MHCITYFRSEDINHNPKYNLLSRLNCTKMVTFSAGFANSYAACSAVACLRSTPLYSRIWSAHFNPTCKTIKNHSWNYSLIKWIIFLLEWNIFFRFSLPDKLPIPFQLNERKFQPRFLQPKRYKLFSNRYLSGLQSQLIYIEILMILSYKSNSKVSWLFHHWHYNARLIWRCIRKSPLRWHTWSSRAPLSWSGGLVHMLMHSRELIYGLANLVSC